MCQAYEGERNYMIWRERQEIKQKYEDHESGKKRLTDEELTKLVIQKLMLSEG